VQPLQELLDAYEAFQSSDPAIHSGADPQPPPVPSTPSEPSAPSKAPKPYAATKPSAPAESSRAAAEPPERPAPALPPPHAWAFVAPGPSAAAEERAAWKRLTYVRQYVRAGGAPGGSGRRPERLMIDILQSFTSAGREMSFEEARAAHVGLLDVSPDHFAEPEPEQAPERDTTMKLANRSRVVDDDDMEVESDDDADTSDAAALPPRAPADSDTGPSTSSSSEDLHAPPVVVTPAPDDSDASFSSADSPGPGRAEPVRFDGGGGSGAGGRTTVLRRMGGMGLGAVAPGAEPTVTINTKESLDDVFAMMNSPEKTVRSGALPGAKYAPVRPIAAPALGSVERDRLPPFGRTLSNENAGTPAARGERAVSMGRRGADAWSSGVQCVR
jgi:hypothetical protein